MWDGRRVRQRVKKKKGKEKKIETGTVGRFEVSGRAGSKMRVKD